MSKLEIFSKECPEMTMESGVCRKIMASQKQVGMKVSGWAITTDMCLCIHKTLAIMVWGSEGYETTAKRRLENDWTVALTLLKK